MQLYSVDQKRSQALEAHAAAFSTIKVQPACILKLLVVVCLEEGSIKRKLRIAVMKQMHLIRPLVTVLSVPNDTVDA